METLVERMKRLLAERGHTRDGKADAAWLAKNANLNHNTVRSWFIKTYDGDEHDLKLTPREIRNICRALDIEPDHLLGFGPGDDETLRSASIIRSIHYLENRIKFLREVMGL